MVEFLKAWWPKIAIVAVGAFVLIQFIPYGVDNPAGSGEPAWNSARTEELFDNACADCHSNDTKVLWFEKVAPVKWYVANHVKEGRAALNVSNWATGPGDEVDEMIEVIEEREMPLASYTYLGLHSEAKLTDAERRELVEGLRATIAADPPPGGGE